MKWWIEEGRILRRKMLEEKPRKGDMGPRNASVIGKNEDYAGRNCSYIRGGVSQFMQ
ncbi:hypothetical protein Hanom_Chr12g01128331 [Helianthus anomalus]